MKALICLHHWAKCASTYEQNCHPDITLSKRSWFQHHILEQGSPLPASSLLATEATRGAGWCACVCVCVHTAPLTWVSQVFMAPLACCRCSQSHSCKHHRYSWPHSHKQQMFVHIHTRTCIHLLHKAIPSFSPAFAPGHQPQKYKLILTLLTFLKAWKK